MAITYFRLFMYWLDLVLDGKLKLHILVAI